MIQGYKDTRNQRYQDKLIHGYKEIRMQGYRYTGIQRYSDTWRQWDRGTWLQRVFECTKTGIKGYKDTRIKIYEDARIQGFMEEGIKKAECKDTVRQENTGKMLQDTGKWTSGIQENAAPEI